MNFWDNYLLLDFQADVFHSDSRYSVLQCRPSMHMFTYEKYFVQYVKENLYSQFIVLNVILF